MLGMSRHYHLKQISYSICGHFSVKITHVLSFLSHRLEGHRVLQLTRFDKRIQTGVINYQTVYALKLNCTLL